MRRMLAALAAAGTIGCALAIGPRAEHVFTGAPRAAYTGAVRIVMEGSPPPDDYEEVAIVSATGEGWDATLPSVLGALQREAASLGCNAVIRVRYDRGAGSGTATGVAVWAR